MAHTLRTLELIGRTDIPVVPGAEYPLVRTKEETELWQQQYGSVAWVGAWTPRFYHPADQLGEMPEGKPTTKALDEDAAHFLVRMARKYPNEITLYAGGPMTNLALAIAIDPEFPRLVQELVFMGAALNPQTTDPEFLNTPRHEFNLWFDPEAAHIMLRAPWKKIVCTTVDVSLKTRMTQALIDKIKTGNSPAAQYVGKYARLWGEYNYLWDELAAMAWLDPSLITKSETRYMDIDLNRGANYGNILTWTLNIQVVRTNPSGFALGNYGAAYILGATNSTFTGAGSGNGYAVTIGNTEKFYKKFVELLMAPTPQQK